MGTGTAGTAVVRLLLPFLDPAGSVAPPASDGGFRFMDTPSAVVERALALVDPLAAGMRPHGQPSAAWLVDQARSLRGLLGGHVLPRMGSLLVDSIQVPRESSSRLAQAVNVVPRAAPWDPPLESALAEGWTDWAAGRATWEGSGPSLLTESLPDKGSVVGLWWD